MVSYIGNIRKMYIYKFLINLHFIGGVLIPFFTQWGKISFLQIMILQSFFSISVSLLEVPSGALADYIGRKKSLLLAAASIGLGALVYSLRSNYYLFFVGEFLWALGGSLMSGADEAMVYDSLKLEKLDSTSKKIFSKFNIYQLSAFIIAAPIGSFVGSRFGLQYAMMLIAMPALMAFLVGLTLEEPKISQHSDKYITTLKSGLTYFREHPILRILAFDRITISALTFLILWTYQPLLTKLGLPIIYFGFVHSGMIFSEIIIISQFSFFEEILGSKRRFLVLSSLVSAVCFILLGFLQSVYYVIPLILLMFGFGMSRQALFQNYLNKFIESDTRATVISTIMLLERLFRAMLYPLVGLLIRWSMQYTFFIIAGMIIIAQYISKVEEEHLID